jgi:hypothetical protein
MGRLSIFLVVFVLAAMPACVKAQDASPYMLEVHVQAGITFVKLRPPEPGEIRGHYLLGITGRLNADSGCLQLNDSILILPHTATLTEENGSVRVSTNAEIPSSALIGQYIEGAGRGSPINPKLLNHLPQKCRTVEQSALSSFSQIGAR